MTENQKPKILIVDDSPSARKRIVTFLSMRDFQIFQAASGSEALESVAKHRPDIILMDAHMPEMDGIECLKRVRMDKKNKKIRVIIMAGEHGFDVRTAAFKSGCSDLVTRPLEEVELLYKIDKLARFIHVSRSARAAQNAMARITTPWAWKNAVKENAVKK